MLALKRLTVTMAGNKDRITRFDRIFDLVPRKLSSLSEWAPRGKLGSQRGGFAWQDVAGMIFWNRHALGRPIASFPCGGKGPRQSCQIQLSDLCSRPL